MCLYLQAQEPVSIHLTEKDGLPDIEFYDMLEDDEGYIWFAADRGLFRYNGKEFTSYSHPLKRGLSVFNLKKDKKGRVWCNNISGQFFYVENDMLQLFKDITSELTYPVVLLPQFTILKEDVYTSTGRGLYHIDFQTKSMTNLYTNQELIFEDVGVCQEEVFLSSDSLISVKNNKSELWMKYDDFNHRRFFMIDDELYFASYSDPSVGKIAETLLYRIDVDSKKVIKKNTPSLLKGSMILSVSEIDNNLWFNTNKGTHVYKMENGRFIHVQSLFKNDFVTRVLKDKNGHYWISSLSNGVYVIPNLAISKFILNGEHENITSILFLEGHLVYGTKEGEVKKVNLQNGTQEVVLKSKKGKVKNLIYNEESNFIFIWFDSRNYFWDLNTGEISAIQPGQSIKDVSAFGNNQLLISTHQGSYLNDFSHLKGQRERLNLNRRPRLTDKIILPKRSRRLADGRSYSNYFTSDSTIYIGQVDKLYFLDKKLRRKEVLFNEEPIYVTDIAETEDGTVWVATSEKGILGLKEDQILYVRNTSNGLPSNRISSIEGDGNNLWIVTDKGLSFYDRSRLLFTFFSFKKELPAQKIVDVRIEGSKVYMASNSGVFVIDKDKLQDGGAMPKVYFEALKINDKPMDLLGKKAFSVSHDQNAFEIYFNTNFFKSAESITYQYKLEGLEKEWKTTVSGIAKYPSLPPGDYYFNVRAMTNKGTISDKVTQVKISISKPFWKEWWFFATIFLTMVLLFLSILRNVKKNQQVLIDKERLDKELVFSQLENLRSQMNPHFIFNALNSIQDYILKNEKLEASMYLAKFSSLIRKYLEHSRQKEIALTEEIETLHEYLELEKVRSGETLKFEIATKEGLPLNQLKVPPLFIQPYVENAIKHGLLHKKTNKELYVSFFFDQSLSNLVCTIRDNGIGRKKAFELKEKREKAHASFSTKANSDRVVLINKGRKSKVSVEVKDLYDDSHSPLGTEVEIIIPQIV